MVSLDAAGGAVGGNGGSPAPDGGAPAPDGALPAPDGALPNPDAAFPTPDANCGHTGIGAVRLDVEILVVLDRSISVAPAQWNDFLSSVAQTISAHNDTIDWGLYAFPQDGPACGAGSVSSAIDVDVGPDDAMHVIEHIAAAGTGASGTPTAAAIQTAAAYMLGLNDQIPKFLMLVTDGAPTCAGPADALSEDPTQAQADAVTAISRTTAAGLRTIVVAPSFVTAAADVDALNALAVAGGFTEAPPGPKYLTEATLPSAFSTTQYASSCTLPLAIAPPVPDVVTVTFNGMTIPRDPSHMLGGWDYTSESHMAIELYGSWCEMLLASRSYQVEVYFGCPNPG